MTIELCKLTTQDLTTHNGFQWEPGVWAPKLSGDQNLCSSSWYHCYEHPLLAVLLNPLHANIQNPRLWKIEVNGDLISDHGLKRGYRTMRLVEEIELPDITTEQRLMFCILCALEVCTESKFVMWAKNWLSGENRSGKAALYVAWAAEQAIDDTAMAALNAIWAAEAIWAARAAADAARAAAEAAEAAAEAADINLIKVAYRAVYDN